MNLSEKKQTAAYNSIAEPITDFRVKYSSVLSEQQDNDLFKLEMEIWARLKAALSITNSV